MFETWIHYDMSGVVFPANSRTTVIRGNMTENETLVDSSIVTSRQTVPYAANKPLSLSRYGISLMDVSVSAVTNFVAYDALGRQIVHIDGRGNTRHTEYNALGQRSASIDALGNRTSFAYDQFGNLASVTDPLGNATVYEYDLRGRKTYEGGATYPVRYTYDVFGNKTTIMTYRNESLGPDSGDVTTWLYDEASGAMTNKVYADGKGPSYGYTPDGKLSQRIWARGIVTDYAYDGWGNMTNTVYSDATPTISVSYDAFGRQVENHDAAGTTTSLYDAFGSLANETVIGVAGTNTIDRFYDTFGRSLGYVLNGVRQSTLAYDPATGRLASMQIPSEQSNNPNNQTIKQFSWNYLPGTDLKSSLAYPNGLSASWAYDAKEQLLQVCNAFPTNAISQYDYTYDAAGRRVACGKSGSAFAQNDTVAYAYNNRSELTNAVAAIDAEYRYAYDFDDIGNRETSSERGTNSVYAANALNQYCLITTLTSDVGLQTSSFTPQFDDDGNQTLIKTATGIWQAQYNGENRPILWTCTQSNTQTITNQTIISMSFDRMGRRVTKNDQRFVYDGYLQIANFEHQTSNFKLQTFIWDPTEPVATRPLVWNFSTFQPFNFSTSYYTHDGNKNVSEVLTADYSIGAHYEYAPFGAVASVTGETQTTDFPVVTMNCIRFSSEYDDEALGLVYYNYRHYISSDGRWSTREPLAELSTQSKFGFYLSFVEDVQFKGLYTFALNSSLLKYDVGGLFASGEKDGWGKDESTSMGNCWRYACNDPVALDKRNDESVRMINPPGVVWNGEWDDYMYSCPSIAAGLKSKFGINKADSDGKCPKCHYKVYLALNYYGTDFHKGESIESIDRYRDYHWYRQDTDSNCKPTGTWSHKRGDGPVEIGVVDPAAHAKDIKYDVPCDYFCFPCSGIDADKP